MCFVLINSLGQTKRSLGVDGEALAIMTSPITEPLISFCGRSLVKLPRQGQGLPALY